MLQVGGDFYDTFALEDGRLGVAVGDVVGHGLEAAAGMGRLRTALAALAAHASGPGELLSHLDAYASGYDAVPFATACCAVLDPATGELRHASAGHPPILVVPRGGRAEMARGRTLRRPARRSAA
jgi:serine phosphatase RsbU (regulator of sigma subunit)